jgi:hypothetical protein
VHRPPLEHLSSLPERALPAELWAASRELVECYYRARFAGVPPDPAELARLRLHLERR